MRQTEQLILVGEDEPEVRSYVELALKCQGYRVEMAENGEEVIDYLRRDSTGVSAVLLDIVMPRKGGMETLLGIRQTHPDLPVIMLSGLSSPVNVVEAMRNGATDFLTKPIGHEELNKVIQKVAFRAPAGLEIDRPIDSSLATGNLFFGTDGSMKAIRATIERIASADVPILILGETGTGKEVLARQVHERSPRAHKPFLKVNCAAVPSELVESELFGYERGAFTGAFQRKAGMFELADGGTIMLDEIGDMDFKLQAKLLQVLQDREFIRLGGKDTVRVDVRIIAATHQNLEKGILENRFRQDLFYRLNVITMRLPSLRERRSDIVDLAHFLLRKNAPPGNPLPQITGALGQALMQYSWPGNIRELENTIHRLLIFQNPEAIAAELLGGVSVPPSSTAEEAPVATPSGSILKRVTKVKEQAEATAIVAALDSCRWNRKQAATTLNIDYKALLYKMKKLNIE